MKNRSPTKVLSDYQVVARDFLLEDKFRCLFDEPGIGKTGPAIMAGLDKAIQHHNTVVVTAPAYLLDNWEREIRDFTRGQKVEILRADGAGPELRREAIQGNPHFLLTSYNNWSAKKNDRYLYPELSEDTRAAYIFDEGHRLRGRNSSWTKHVFRLRHTSSRNKSTPIWILTGTPFVRDGGDFWPYFYLYDKKAHSSYWRFVQERCVVVETPWKKDVRNIRKAYADEFRRELSEFSLRRTVGQIPSLSNLEYRDSEYFVDLPKSVLATIQKMKREYVLEHPDLARSEFLKGAGAAYVEQRRITTVPPTKVNPKLEWLKDFLADHPGKVVVYVWYKDSARAVFDSLPVEAGSNNYLVTGDTTAQRRTAIVDLWKDDGKVLVATIPSLKEGISLTEARDVVFLEHSELPADQEQCTKRLCRRGQTHLVRAHHVWANKSVDMVIRRVLGERDLGISEALREWISDESGTEEADDWFV